jgi:LAO/AO transport system kinase
MVDEISMVFEITVKEEIDRPPVVKTVASTGEGVGFLLGLIRQMADELQTSGELAKRRKVRIANQVSSIVEREMLKDIWESRDLRSRVKHVTEEIFGRRTTPYAAARRIVEDLERRMGDFGGSK